jgi:hypothetical protein
VLSDGERFVFLHIPKCAGSSVHSVLSANFRREEIFPRYGHDLVREPFPELARYRYLAGHFSKAGVDRIPGPKWIVTVLREPKARVLSLYYFWRSFTDAHIEAHNLRGPRLAKSMDLLSFLTSEDRFILHNIRNAQTRTLTGPMLLTPPFQDYESEWMVDAAFANLMRLNHVAFAETLDADMAEICRRFGFEPPAETPRANAFGAVNPAVSEPVEKEPMTEAIDAALTETTRLDAALYARATATRALLRCPYPS